MKIRNGFVSNSSSSSFILLKDNLNKKQIDMIYNHIKIGEMVDKELKKQNKDIIYEYYEEWFIEEDDFSLWCHTSMDNFDLETFLIREINIDNVDIIYMGDAWDSIPLFKSDEYLDFKLKTRSKKLNKLKNNIDEE